MDSLSKNLGQWKVFQDLAPSYVPSETYEAVSTDPEADPTWRTRAFSTGHIESQVNEQSMRAPESYSHSATSTAGFFSTAVPMNILRLLRPSFLLSRHNPNYKPYKIQATTYLNGVRGFAAFCVYLQHYLVKYFKFLDRGYLSGPEESRLLQLPFIRLIFTGRFMVANFFILSGFVLACKPLRLIRKRDASFLGCLASSVFRRWPRLFLPLIPPMFLSGIFNYLRWYHPQPIAQPFDPNYKYPSLFHRLSDEYYFYTQLVNPFTWNVYMPKNTPQMWTLPMEFRGSMVVFLALLCLCKAKTVVRVSMLAGFAWYCLQTAHWDTFLFVNGILLAEFHLIQKENNYSLEDFLHFLNMGNGRLAIYVPLFSKMFWLIFFIFGLFLGSWPCERASVTPGLITLDSLTPARYHSEELHGYFWYSIAAVMIMFAFENLSFLRRPFATPLAIYMGDISFAFYIIHWTYLWTIGRVITNEAMSAFGEHLGFAVAAIFVIPVSICIADVYWRVFDNGAVNFARWTWVKCSIPEPSHTEGLSNGN